MSQESTVEGSAGQAGLQGPQPMPAASTALVGAELHG